MISVLLDASFLISLFIGFLYKNRKLKIVSLISFILIGINVIVSISFGIASRRLEISDFLIGIPFSMFMIGIPLFLLAGIPISVVYAFKNKDRRWFILPALVILLGVVWWFAFGYWIDRM